MNRYVPRTAADVADLIREYPLGLVVSKGEAGHAVTPLPLLAELGSEGEIKSLFGHIALSNPQAEIFARDPRALIIFQGPQAYVSPRLVSNLTWGPTWNYALVTFEVDIRLVPEETEAALDALAKQLEGGDWVPRQMGDRYLQLRQRIIAFRGVVRGMEAKFKLGQDEDPETFREIVQGIDAPDLARWMRRSTSA